MVLTHAATGRPLTTKKAQSMFGQDRETVEQAFPGDVIGLVNATALRPGDTLHAAVVPVLSSDLRGDQAPVLAAVGPLQYDVVLHRLEHEFGARAELDHLDYSMARRTDADGARALAGQRAVEVLTRRHDGALLALFSDKWRLAQVQREHPGILLEPLIAG